MPQAEQVLGLVFGLGRQRMASGQSAYEYLVDLLRLFRLFRIRLFRFCESGKGQNP
jgi:hypothetical protein